jgi:hypothetical protein
MLITIKAKIKIAEHEDSTAWIEEFTIDDYNDARECIESIVKHFNETLRPGEEPRKLVEIVSEQLASDIDCSTPEAFFKRARDFKVKVKKEAFNACGSRWCHEMEQKVIDAYNRLHLKGGVTRYKKLVMESPYQHDYQRLINSPLKSLKVKEQKL